jgi:hypothetical protein
MRLEKYSFGIGDRFARQGKALLAAVVKAKEAGAAVTPVWNKSNREHQIIGTEPSSVRAEADAAVGALGWKGAYHVDADHIGMAIVDRFMDGSDFFTLDVADFIGKAPDATAVATFADEYGRFAGELAIEGIERGFAVTKEMIKATAAKYLAAVKEAGRIYRHIESVKGGDNFTTEVSMDETDQPQTPAELFFILAALADEGIPIQTIAPKFTGRFNKGVEYVGDIEQFTKEFEQDLAVIRCAVREFGLAENLKLSVHSGSDKFAIYGPMKKAIKETGAGLHVKTAGTTWLEEVTGLALAGGEGLAIARKIYAEALDRCGELCGPYATVIDIDTAKLPSADEVEGWSGEDFAAALQHDQSCPQYNQHFRQLVHVAYKVAAEMGKTFTDALVRHEQIIARCVTENIYERHLKPLFID